MAKMDMADRRMREAVASGSQFLENFDVDADYTPHTNHALCVQGHVLTCVERARHVAVARRTLGIKP